MKSVWRVWLGVVLLGNLAGCGDDNQVATDGKGPADAGQQTSDGGDGGSTDGGLTHALTVTRAGAGSGTVSSTPNGIDCGATCTASFAAGANVSLTAVSDPGSVFAGWSGDCSGATDCSVALDDDRAVEATFELGVTLSVTVQGPGKVTSSPAGIDCSTGTCSATFAPGTGVTLSTEFPNSSSFAGWGATGPCAGQTNSCAITLTSDVTLTTRFLDWVVGQPFPPRLAAAGAVGPTLVALGGDGKFVTAPDALSWTARSLPGTGEIRGVASSAGGAVAVGDGGTVLTSTDGLAWSAQSSGVSGNLHGVVYGVSSYVAVGDGGVILSSPDGMTWTPRTSGTTEHLLGVVHGGTQFIAVGYAGTILTSPDGATWTSRTSGTTQYLNDIAYGGSTYVAVGGNGTILTSPDGTTWTTQTSGQANVLRSVAFGDGTFVAAGENANVLTSTDGVTWTPRVISIQGSGESVVTIRWLGSRYLAVTDLGAIFESADATMWSPVLSPGQYEYPNCALDFMRLTSVAYGASTYVAGGTNGIIRTSPDGVVWTSRRAGGRAEGGLIIAYGDSNFVALASGVSGEVLTSPDGITWTSQGPGPGGWFPTALASGNGTFVAASQGNQVFTSTNGTDWTGHDPGWTQTPMAVTYGSELFVATGWEGMISTSPDGITWTPRDSGVSDHITGVAFGADRFVAVSSATFLTSPDGANWTAGISPGIVESGVTFGDSLFVAVGEAFLASYDGVTWPQWPNGSNPVRGGSVVVHGDSGFVTVGDCQTIAFGH